MNRKLSDLLRDERELERQIGGIFRMAHDAQESGHLHEAYEAWSKWEDLNLRLENVRAEINQIRKYSPVFK